MHMESTIMGTSRVPPAPDKTRKIITLPKALAERIRAFRFARQYDRESEAYVVLLEAGLEALEQPALDRERSPGRGKPRS
jgi:hypothetical protein